MASVDAIQTFIDHAHSVVAIIYGDYYIVRPEPIIPKMFPIILFSNSHKGCLLFQQNIPIIFKIIIYYLQQLQAFITMTNGLFQTMRLFLMYCNITEASI